MRAVAHRVADFPPRTRRLIAERAGYRCSKPDCRRQTLGPGAGPRDVACIGVACHIYSAADGGPRGTGGLTPEQRQFASNGIWLCADHARLIDANRGLGYPAPLLRGWRQLHEAFLVHEMRGLVPPCALVTEVSVRQGPAALTARPVPLSALSIITGPNSAGKTTLLNLLARAGRDETPGRRPWDGGLSADIHWFDPQPNLLQLTDHDGDLELVHDHRPAPLLSAPYRAVTVRAPMRPVGGPDGLAGLLGLDRRAFLQLLREVPRCLGGDVSHVDVSGGIPVVSLRSRPDPVRLDGDAFAWGGSIILFEAAIALAQAHSRNGPALLLVDDFGDCLHPVVSRRLLTLLATASQGFQTVVVTHQPLTPEILRDWAVTVIGADHQELPP